jgi:hypothetical protein
MILRTASIVVAGALLAGCNSSRVQGEAAYYDDSRVYGDRSFRSNKVQGETAYRQDVKDVEATADARTASATLDADRARESAVDAAPTTPRDPAANDNKPVIQPGWADPERAAYAASAKFPADAQALNEVPLTASVDREHNELVIRNNSDQALNNVNVWVNGKYVAWVGQIPANERVSLPTLSFSDAGGRSLKDWGEANAVQLQSGDKLFNTTGLEKR